MNCFICVEVINVVFWTQSNYLTKQSHIKAIKTIPAFFQQKKKFRFGTISVGMQRLKVAGKQPAHI